MAEKEDLEKLPVNSLVHAPLENAEHLYRYFSFLRENPPQSIIFEGGTQETREALALQYAAFFNCKQAKDGKPCFICSTCKQILIERVFNDLLFFDTKAGVKVEDIREKRAVWGVAPYAGAYRVTVFNEAQKLGLESANTLLKTLEDPRPQNLFVILTPQREQLLKTIVSRSFVFILPHKQSGVVSSDAQGSQKNEANKIVDTVMQDYLYALLNFWTTGIGWFEKSTNKEIVSVEFALNFFLAIQQQLRFVFLKDCSNSFSCALEKMSLAELQRIQKTIALAEEALLLKPSNVDVPLVLDWFATHALVEK